MARLEDLTRDASVRGILPDRLITVVDVKWHGSNVVELTYKDGSGHLGNELIYRDREPTLEVISAGRPWSFDGDGALFRLASEAHRIRLAYLFDPVLAVHTSLVDPLPHQITAVYGEMLTRQPLRFLLADDPGAGKTIMAGLLIKELMIRGDLRRCLIVVPGMLVEQWQDELDRRFHLPFEIMTNDKLEAARTGNWFFENPLAICRLDKLSRNEDLQAKLQSTDWDLVVVDEAHKMSAAFFGGEVKETKRYKLGKLLSHLTRHFLLMTATPHNGKEEDFQLFMALLDGDRFEGKFRDGVHTVDVSDLIRRMVKEKLLKFDGRPLFPERLAYTVTYQLSAPEADLYKRVTDYVREEFNRADALQNGGQKGTVGFALTILQRRLASSPEAIYQSLRRRRERLESRLREERLMRRGAEARTELASAAPEYEVEDIDDLDDVTSEELEEAEEKVVDQATAAKTIAELEGEIQTLKELEALALKVRRSESDKKWEELRSLLLENPNVVDAEGHRRKLVIFTEHRDTLNYLVDKIGSLLGRHEAVVQIHGGMGREERRKAQEAFTQDREVEILVATDAAGEGINLQRAHLMVNYDLPWNPSRLEQRFGRIHRIGQTEVCHLWNLVAGETREGDVFKRLFEKLDEQRQTLGGGIFDIMGKLFRDKPLRELLIEAVRYGDQPEVRARLLKTVDNLADRQHCEELLDDRSNFIASGLALTDAPTEQNVPAVIRNRDRMIGTGTPLLPRYERVTFEKELISIPGKSLAEFICPGHPLLDATIDIVLERYRDLLKRGAVLVSSDEADDKVRALFYLEHSIQDARTDVAGNRRLVSRQMQFVTIDEAANVAAAGYAPYLDFRPLKDDERRSLEDALGARWLNEDLEGKVQEYAVTELVPRHLSEIKTRKEALIDKTMMAVRDRLTKEINYWDHRAEELKAQELAGKTPRLNSGRARQRAEDLEARLLKRMEELEQERKLSPLPPVVIGGALVVTEALLRRLKGEASPISDRQRHETERVEKLAMEAVTAAEKRLGFEPLDVSKENRGYDIESRIPGQGRLRFIEVKGRVAGATTVTVTKNEILTGLNKPDEFILAVVEVHGDSAIPRYIKCPFGREPDFGVTSVNYKLDELLARSISPA